MLPTPTPLPVPDPVTTSLPVPDPAITLGSWPDWIAAVGTALAFLIAAVSYLWSVKVRREAQARLVYAEVATNRWRKGNELYALANGADSPALAAHAREEPDSVIRSI